MIKLNCFFTFILNYKMSNFSTTSASSLHELYIKAKQTGKQQSLGDGESIITKDGSGKIHMKSCGSTLSPKDASVCPVIKEFLSFDKKDRSNGTALGSLALSDGRTVEVFMMTLHKDEDYLKCSLLFRCHALLRIKNLDGSYDYYDTGAHRKFYNMDTPSNPSTMSSNILLNQSSIKMVELHEKVSGSQILCLVAPPELKDHFLFMFFSKRGTSNIYSDLGCKAFTNYVANHGHTMLELYQYLINREVVSMTFEVMGVDRHVSMDNDVGSLIMHGVSLKNGMKMPLETMTLFGTKLGFDVVKLLFRSDAPDSFEKALKVYQNYDCEGNTNEGGVMTIHYDTGIIEKLKCKTWWYLYLRDFRQCIPSGQKSEVIPTIDGQLNRLEMFGVPENDRMRFAQKYVLWWLWVRSNECTSEFQKNLDDGDHPLVIDHFLNIKRFNDLKNYESFYNELLLNQRGNPCIIPLGINVGLMGSGKSSTSKLITVSISQDQCGGDRKNLVKEAIKYLMDGASCQKALVLDRTNLNAELRSSLLWDLHNELGRNQFKKNLLLMPFFICHEFPNTLPGQLPISLLERILQNRQDKKSHESLTLEGTGTLSVIEILRNASNTLVYPRTSSECVFLDPEDAISTKVNTVQNWFKTRYPNPELVNKLDESPKTYDKFGDYQVNTKMKKVYAGYSVPHHNLVSNPILGVYFEEFLKANPDATEHNSHITIAYGADKMAQRNWTEGKIKKLSWIGTFEQKDKVCGSILLDVDSTTFSDLKTLPMNTLVYHVSGWTASGVQPVQSNTVLNTATGTTGEKPTLESFLKLFEKNKTYHHATDNITLTLFDVPVPVQGYEGTYCRK
jgi:hypothetical protein